MDFGQMVLRARTRSGFSQKDVAARVTKDDGRPITPQYLHDIEIGRRRPRSDVIVEHLAAALAIPREVAFYYADLIPPEMRQLVAEDRAIVAAYAAFHHELLTG